MGETKLTRIENRAQRTYLRFEVSRRRKEQAGKRTLLLKRPLNWPTPVDTEDGFPDARLIPSEL